jgi:hypothetical protein
MERLKHPATFKLPIDKINAIYLEPIGIGGYRVVIKAYSWRANKFLAYKFFTDYRSFINENEILDKLKGID